MTALFLFPLMEEAVGWINHQNWNRTMYESTAVPSTLLNDESIARCQRILHKKVTHRYIMYFSIVYYILQETNVSVMYVPRWKLYLFFWNTQSAFLFAIPANIKFNLCLQTEKNRINRVKHGGREKKKCGCVSDAFISFIGWQHPTFFADKTIRPLPQKSLLGGWLFLVQSKIFCRYIVKRTDWHQQLKWSCSRHTH